MVPIEPVNTPVPQGDPASKLIGNPWWGVVSVALFGGMWVGNLAAEVQTVRKDGERSGAAVHEMVRELDSVRIELRHMHHTLQEIRADVKGLQETRR